MKESTTYQATVEEGRAKGLIEGETKGKIKEARTILQSIGSRRFGEPSKSDLQRLSAVSTLQELHDLINRALEAASWEELLATLPPPRKRRRKQ